MQSVCAEVFGVYHAFACGASLLVEKTAGGNPWRVYAKSSECYVS